MNAYEHKTTREIRCQEFSPVDDWELMVAPTWVDWAWGFALFVAFIGFLVWANGQRCDKAQPANQLIYWS